MNGKTKPFSQYIKQVWSEVAFAYKLVLPICLILNFILFLVLAPIVGIVEASIWFGKVLAIYGAATGSVILGFAIIEWYSDRSESHVESV